MKRCMVLVLCLAAVARMFLFPSTAYVYTDDHIDDPKKYQALRQHRLRRLSIVLTCMIAVLSACEKQDSIIGSWEVESNVIGVAETDSNSESRYILSFMEDHTGKEEMIFDGRHDERHFTYTVVDDEIQIKFESGSIWNFPFSLDDDHLILTQHHQEVIYSRR